MNRRITAVVGAAFAGAAAAGPALSAAGQGAKFELRYQGATVPGTGSPGPFTAYGAEPRDTWAGWPGAGDRAACVTDNGTADTNVRLALTTDGEVG
ncbi:hypothetical protein [Streptomyces sp. NPDC045470]|uniref:hypothetical protein n=1 Tax=unclassified Streptomyces TaxID=2593676 RepID=UPI0033FA3528